MMNAPSWSPKGEEELQRAAEQGALAESHHLDIKRELRPGKSANIELARDLASFAVDGGLVVFGVDEKATTPALHPIPLDGLSERIEQVALSRIDEPLAVSTTAIPSAGDPDIGYAVVRIPPSPLAPHMVEGRYYGRGDKTKYVLSNDEVFRLHQQRRHWEETAGTILDAYVGRDPVSVPSQAHLFLVAEPVAAREDLLVHLIEDGPDPWQRRLLDLVHTRALSKIRGGGSYSPNMGEATLTARRANGWALTTHRFGDGREPPEDAKEAWLLELEMTERGGLRLYCGRATDSSQDHERVFFEQLVVGLCHSLLALLRQIAEETGYWGSWDLGVAVTDLRGAVSWFYVKSFRSTGPGYSDAGYRMTTRTTFEEASSRANAVADRLLGRIIRAFGTRATREMRELLD